MVLTTYHWKSFTNNIPINEAAKTSISFFPNPTNGIITIKTEKELINTVFIITDVYGRLIIKGRLDSTLILHFDNLPIGIYLLRIGQNLQSIVKIIKI